jgi:amino acid permease
MGRWMKICVLIIIDINQFGVSVIYLLLAAKAVAEAALVLTGTKYVDPCLVTIALALVLWPLSFLKSPGDFGW